MAITLEQLLVVKAAADTGSFSAAARRLGKAQSTVSATISNLELETGVKLFDREGRFPRLTEVGGDLLEHISTLVVQANNLEGKFNAYSTGIEHELTLMVDAAIPYELLAPTLKAFYQQYPYVTLHIKHQGQEQALDQLLNDQCALALQLTQPNYPEALSFCRLGSLKLAEVAHPDHPLCQLQPVTFADLSNYRQLIFAPHGRSLITAEYLRSPQRLYADSFETLLQMTLDGLGWSVLPLAMVAPLIEQRRLVELVLKTYPYTKWEVGVDLVWSSRAARGPAARWLQREFSGYSINQ